MKKLKEIKVKEVMNKGGIVSVKREMPAKDLAHLFIEKNISGVPVVNDNDELIGVVSTSDIARSEAIMDLKGVLELIFFNASDELKREVDEHLVDNYHEMDVYYIMTPDPVTVTPDDTLDTAVRCLIDKKIHRVFVVENGKLAGIITVTDILTLFLNEV